MRRCTIRFATFSLVVSLYAVVSLPAQAQPFQQSLGPRGFAPQPAVSPYLNLIRTGSDPGINYYGLVRPQIGFRRDILGLGQQVTNLSNVLSSDAQSMAQPLVTGHPVRFQNYLHYYGNPLTSGPVGIAGSSAAQQAIPGRNVNVNINRSSRIR